MVSEEQEARVARAARQSFAFTLYNPGEWICETEAGHSYLVTEGGQCTCADAQYRCTERGDRCKHAVALAHHLIAIQPRPEPGPRACRSCGTVESPAAPLAEHAGWLLCGICADEGPEPSPEPIPSREGEDFDRMFARIFG